MRVGRSELERIVRDLGRKPLTDNQVRTLIESLWRDSLVLYNEKFRKERVLDGLGNPIDPWQRNKIIEGINFGQALGQDNLVEGNRSIAIGQGGVTKSFEEIVLGAYNIITTGQNAGAWIPTDLLMTLGNGPDDLNRSNAMEVFKSGLIRIFNGLKLGKYQHGVILPEAGMLQFDPAIGFTGYTNQKWNKLAFIAADAEDGKLTWYDRLTNTLKTGNVSSGEIATLDHINEIIDDLVEYLENGITTSQQWTTDNNANLYSLLDHGDHGLTAHKLTSEEHPRDARSQIKGSYLSAITKAMVEDVLTGAISTHTHDLDVQSDWNQTVNTQPDFIKNKPNVSVQDLLGTSVNFDVRNGMNAKIELSGNTTILFQNLTVGASGNISVLNVATAYTVTFSGYTFSISPAVYLSLNTVQMSGASKKDALSYYYDGVKVIINGTLDYN